MQSDTYYPEKTFKKSKILNMPKMAQNGPKWPKLGPNTSYFCILRLNFCIWTVKRPLKSVVMSILPNSWPIKYVSTFHAQNSCFLVFFMPKWMRNSFFYAEILNTDCTLNSIKISKKSKIFNMPKMAKNGPKWPKLGPNTF